MGFLQCADLKKGARNKPYLTDFKLTPDLSNTEFSLAGVRANSLDAGHFYDFHLGKWLSFSILKETF
jgi:hypothetical protein